MMRKMTIDANTKHITDATTIMTTGWNGFEFCGFLLSIPERAYSVESIIAAEDPSLLASDWPVMAVGVRETCMTSQIKANTSVTEADGVEIGSSMNSKILKAKKL